MSRKRRSCRQAAAPAAARDTAPATRRLQQQPHCAQNGTWPAAPEVPRSSLDQQRTQQRHAHERLRAAADTHTPVHCCHRPSRAAAAFAHTQAAGAPGRSKRNRRQPCRSSTAPSRAAPRCWRSTASSPATLAPVRGGELRGTFEGGREGRRPTAPQPLKRAPRCARRARLGQPPRAPPFKHHPTTTHRRNNTPPPSPLISPPLPSTKWRASASPSRPPPGAPATASTATSSASWRTRRRATVSAFSYGSSWCTASCLETAVGRGGRVVRQRRSAFRRGCAGRARLQTCNRASPSRRRCQPPPPLVVLKPTPPLPDPRDDTKRKGFVVVTDEAAGRTIPNAFLDRVKDDFVAR